MRRVLVPLDGTKNAEAAIESLEQICTPGDEVVLLTVKSPEPAERAGFRPGNVVSTGVAGGFGGAAMPDVPNYVETTDQASQRQVNQARDYLEGLAANLRHKGYKVDTEVILSDKPDQAIVQHARNMHPTFIAMLRRTHSVVGDILFGGTALSVLRADVAPVLLVTPAK
jgi:nucleotide-binding universal stress UspA family protein